MSPKISEEAKEERKQLLLHAALECFAKNGYYATSVDDIVAFANLSKGSFYNYFSSKEELFISLLEAQTTLSLYRLKEKLLKMETAVEKLKYIIRLDLPFNELKKKMMRVQLEFWMYSTGHPEIKKILTDRYEIVLTIVKDIIEMGIETGEFRKNLDPEKAASMFWALHDGIWIHSIVLDEKTLVESKIIEMEKTLLKYLCE
jgi:AcrR family transcriptional regulator